MFFINISRYILLKQKHKISGLCFIFSCFFPPLALSFCSTSDQPLIEIVVELVVMEKNNSPL